MKRPAHDCPDCTHVTDICPDCGASTEGEFRTEHRSGYGDLAEWCPRHPIVIAVKAEEKRRGVYDPDEWAA